jgi:hypothetical protein
MMTTNPVDLPHSPPLARLGKQEAPKRAGHAIPSIGFPLAEKRPLREEGRATVTTRREADAKPAPRLDQASAGGLRFPVAPLSIRAFPVPNAR